MFPGDDGGLMLYGSTLLEWSAGDRLAARSLLRQAIAVHRRALKYLDGRETVPDDDVAGSRL